MKQPPFTALASPQESSFRRDAETNTRDACAPRRLALALLVLCSTAHAQLSPEKELATFQPDASLTVALAAAEPLVESPCAIAFDDQGRMYVAENRGYPNFADPPLGRVARLEDTDGDGRYDKRTTFLDGLAFPNGVMPWRDGLIVTASPDILFVKDTDGDGRADYRKVLLTGFDTAKSTQLRVNAPTLGPDGWIYFAAGLSGGEIKSPKHPEKPALKMTGDIRWNPDTGDFETVDGKSQFGQSFDDFGRRFICMNRLPVQHVVLESKWLRRNPRLAFADTVQDCNERSVRTGLKGGGDGVRLFPISSNITTADSHAGSFSAACGIRIWRSGSALPALFDGAALSCDPTGNLVHADRLVPRGASFAAEPILKDHELLASSDDWFRPVFLARGPDGALYIADMYRKTIEHPDYLPEEVRKHTDFESGKKLGRIWRVTAKEKRTPTPLAAYRDEFAEIRAAANDGAAMQRFAMDENPRVRFGAALVLGDVKGEQPIPALVEIARRDSADKWTRAAVLSGIGGREPAFLRALWPKITGETEGELELLGALGRCFGNPEALQDALGDAKMSPGIAALWSGFFERNPTAGRALLGTPDLARVREIATLGITKADAPVSQRLIFARLLTLTNWDVAAKPLEQAFARTEDETLRTTIIRSLAALDANRAAALLLAPGNWPRYSPPVREAILAALLARSTQLGGLLSAVESGALPASALNSQRRAIFTKHKDAEIRDRATKLFAATETTPAASQAKVKAALELTANAPHGKQVFKQLCAQCHRLEQEGVTVGPDLLDIRKQPKENVAFHIIAPDAEIAPAFTAYTAELRDGRTLAGILTSETGNTIAIKQPGGSEEAILRGDVKSLTALPGSLMPTGLDAALQPQDLADLLAFLKGEK